MIEIFFSHKLQHERGNFLSVSTFSCHFSAPAGKAGSPGRQPVRGHSTKPPHFFQKQGLCVSTDPFVFSV